MTDAEWIAFFSKPEIAAFNRTMAENADAPLPRLVFADWVEESCAEPRFVAAMRKSIDRPSRTLNCSGLPRVPGATLGFRFGRLDVDIGSSSPAVARRATNRLFACIWPSGWVGNLTCRNGLPDESSLRDAGPVFPLLEGLAFNRQPLGTSVARRLFAGLRTPQLRRLDLSGCRIGDIGAMALSRCESLCELNELNLSDNDLSAGGAGAIIGSKALPSLTSLNLSGNPIGDEGLQHFLHAKPRQPLKLLQLFGTDIGSVGAGFLAAAPCLSELDGLLLDAEDLGVAGVTALANSRYLPEHIRKQWRRLAEYAQRNGRLPPRIVHADII